jgi:hypothetical protein
MSIAYAPDGALALKGPIPSHVDGPIKAPRHVKRHERRGAVAARRLELVRRAEEVARELTHE